MTTGELVLKNVKWEQFADAIAKGKNRADAYMQVYGMKERRTAQAAACRMFKSKDVIDRITFLSNGKMKYPKTPKSGKPKELNLQTVIQTCQEVLDTSESNPQKLQAILVLNKLGVFDGETKGDKGRMDPASICAWLAQFAGAPAENLAKIPGGLKGMLKSLMELTGTTNEDLIAELTDKPNMEKKDEGEHFGVGEGAQESGKINGEGLAVPEEAAGENPPKPSKPSESEPLDFEKEIDEAVDDETLVETITAPVEPEKPSEAMRERLAPALAVGEGFAPSPILENINAVLENENKAFNQVLDKLAEEGRAEF